MIAIRLALLAVLLALLVLPAASSAPAAAQGVGDGCVRVTYRVGTPPLTEACPTPTPTATSTPTVTPTFTPTSTPTPTDTPTPTATDTATPTSTLTPTATATATPAPRLLFSDEFDGTALDATKWRTTGQWGWAACTSAKNISVSGGALHLRAIADPTICGTPWSGAVIQTSYSANPDTRAFTYTYGYLEARVRVPAGQGLFPSVWLYSWANDCNEINVAEFLGAEAHTTFRGTVHYAPINPGCAIQNTAAVSGTDWADGQWHTISLDWAPGVITWYADGAAVRTVRDTRVPNGRMFPILKISTGRIGDSWAGAPDATTPSPSVFDTDWLRIWERKP